MKKENIEQIIKALFRESLRLYPHSYIERHTMPGSVEDAAKRTALGYWINRTEDEVKRDEEAGVTIDDYETWTVQQLHESKK